MFNEDTWNAEKNEESGSRQENGTPVSQNPQNTQGSQNIQGSQSTQGAQNVQNGQSAQAGQNMQNGQNVQGGPNPYPYGYYQNPNGQNPYHNPYQQYGYYQNPNGQNPNGQNPNGHGPNGQNPNQHHQKNRPHKGGSLVKTTALVTAAALLFGVVAGGTMFGVNRVAEVLMPAPTQAAPAETESPKATVQTTPAVASGNAAQSGTVALADVSGIVDSVMPSVVAITNTMVYQSFGWFGQSQTYEVPSGGSGIIVGENDKELLVVTNNHVIENANDLVVTFIDNESVNAAVKGTDAEADLAVIAIPLDQIKQETKDQIKTAVLGDSGALKLGEGVVAIGNALGRGQSVTVGYVSALDREIKLEGVTKKMIQTDAAINPGNSGGALINSAGEVIGINEAKSSASNTEGMGYAIPVSQVKDIIDELMNRTTKIEVEEAERGYLGVQLRNVDAQAAALYGMPQGAFIYQIIDGTAAAASDLHERDIITKVDGERVSSSADLTEMLTYYKAGDTVTLTVEYQDGGDYVEREVQVTLGKRPQEESEQ